ncbi:heavy-metal-associated domain-containing protein [Roseivivax sp. CAU 1761]
MARFHVPDMSCGHCEATIREALAAALPGARVEVDRDARLVRVEDDAECARDTIAKAGYRAEPVA